MSNRAHVITTGADGMDALALAFALERGCKLTTHITEKHPLARLVKKVKQKVIIAISK